tara:strand:+ start:247 stop:534 length:288 start_codon:yes stop_codon:yes gene_type:complete
MKQKEKIMRYEQIFRIKVNGYRINSDKKIERVYDVKSLNMQYWEIRTTCGHYIDLHPHGREVKKGNRRVMCEIQIEILQGFKKVDYDPKWGTLSY